MRQISDGVDISRAARSTRKSGFRCAGAGRTPCRVRGLTTSVANLVLLSAICAGCGGGASNSTPVAGFTKMYSFGPGDSSAYITVSPSGNVYLTSQGKEPAYLAIYSDFGKGMRTTLPFPGKDIINGSVFISPSNGDIYGPDIFQILAFSPSLQYITSFQEPQITKYPAGPYLDGIVIDSKGNVYESDGYNIIQYNAVGTYLTTIPVNAAGLGPADDIAIDSSDNLYVGNGGYVAKFSTAGKLLERFTCSSSAGADISIAVDGSGNIYTESINSSTVIEYSPSGTIKAIQADLGPYIAVDTNGNVYTAGATAINVYHSTGS